MLNKRIMFYVLGVGRVVDEGSPVDRIYLDVQKTIFNIPHERMILELKSHGIGHVLIKWVGQWLTDNSQKVMDVLNWKPVGLGAHDCEL